MSFADDIHLRLILALSLVLRNLASKVTILFTQVACHTYCHTRFIMITYRRIKSGLRSLHGRQTDREKSELTAEIVIDLGTAHFAQPGQADLRIEEIPPVLVSNQDQQTPGQTPDSEQNAVV